MKLLKELWSLESRRVNVLSGGAADMTLSARAHKDALGVEKIIDWFFWTVFREKNHCEVWWIEEVGRSRATIEWMRRTSTCKTCQQLEDSNYV